MSSSCPCTCGRRPRDHEDLAVSCLKGNFSAFNGYHWTPSDWSEVRCLRPNCPGMWRTKSNFVYSLPNCTRDPNKVDRLREEVAARYARKREESKFVGAVVGAVSEALGDTTGGAVKLATQFSAPFSSSRVALLKAHRAARDPHGIATCPRCFGEIAEGRSTCEGCGKEIEDVPEEEDLP